MKHFKLNVQCQKKKKNPGNTKSAYWNKQSEVQHTHQMTMSFFFFFFPRDSSYRNGRNEQKDLMTCDNSILISRGNKSIIHKNKIYNTYKILKSKNESSPPKKQPKSLKPVSFEAFQTIVFFKILNALEKCSYLYY